MLGDISPKEQHAPLESALGRQGDLALLEGEGLLVDSYNGIKQKLVVFLSNLAKIKVGKMQKIFVFEKFI